MFLLVLFVFWTIAASLLKVSIFLFLGGIFALWLFYLVGRYVYRAANKVSVYPYDERQKFKVRILITQVRTLLDFVEEKGVETYWLTENDDIKITLMFLTSDKEKVVNSALQLQLGLEFLPL